jgi:hypothetical protein
VKFLNITIYNQKEMHDQYLKDGQYGLPVRSSIAATSDISQSELSGMAFLENKILKLSENEIPLKSSNVQSGNPNAETGRPIQDEVDDTGEVTREQQ